MSITQNCLNIEAGTACCWTDTEDSRKSCSNGTRLDCDPPSHHNNTDVSNSSLVHVFEPLFWTGQLLNMLQLKAPGHFDGSNFNADPHKLQVK